MANSGDNVLTGIYGKILARAYNAVLRGRCVMPGLVNSDLKAELLQKGETIDIEVAPTMGTQAVTPSNTLVAVTGKTVSTIPLKIDQWRESDTFGLSSKQLNDVAASETYFPQTVGSAVTAVAEYVNSYMMTAAKNAAYTVVGTAGTTPFGSNIAAVTAAAQALDDAKAPMVGRQLVLDTAAKAAAANLDTLREAFRAGDNNTVKTGEVGSNGQTYLGFGWNYDQQVVFHTAGTITTGLAAKASTAQAIGLSTIVATTAASTGACALVVGDIITFAGSAQTYVVTAAATQAAAATDVNVSISPPLVKALAGSEAITVRASHRCNLAFSNQAIALGVRMAQLGDVSRQAGYIAQPSFDAISNLMLRLCGFPQYKQDGWNVDVLFGTVVNRPEHVVRILG